MGWIILAASLALLVLNIITTLEIYFQPTSLPTFLMMFVLVAAGLGLIVRSFRDAGD